MKGPSTIVFAAVSSERRNAKEETPVPDNAMTAITSLQNQRVKDAGRLRHARHRARQGRILIDGAREMIRAIEAGVQVAIAVHIRS